MSLPAHNGRTAPLVVAFVGSLLLSWIAHSQGALLNRDGILYVEIARSLLDQGIGVLGRGFDWPFLPLLMAGLSWLSGLSPESAGHLLNAFFLAGACALLVALTRQRMPEAAWLACLVALALPAYNGYRSDLLREYGFWCFSLLAFWWALRWEATGRWSQALASQGALAIAMLFRLEAVVFYPALMCWQCFSAPTGQRMRRVLMISALPLTGAALGVLLFGSGLVPLPARLVAYLAAIDPLQKLQIFHAAAARMSEHVFPFKYSREEAGYILFFGLASLVPIKFLKLLGVFLVPFAYSISRQPLRGLLARWPLLAWAFLCHILALLAFVTQNFFLSARYVSMLDLLAVPLLAAGLLGLLRLLPRWRPFILLLAFLTMVANVVSFSPPKTHIVEAGRWLGAHVPDAARVGVDNARIAYYAGWRAAQAVGQDRAELGVALAQKRIDMVAVEASRKDDGLDEWLAAHHLQPVQRFANKAGDAVIVAVPDQASAATTERSRAKTGSME